jgi:hypothetical protein
MVVALYGGPLDGAMVEGPSHLPPFLVVSSHQDGPVYKSACCTNCGPKRNAVPYYFHGYDRQLRQQEKAATGK